MSANMSSQKFTPHDYFTQSMQDLTIPELESLVARTTASLEYYSTLAEKKRILAEDPKLTEQAARQLLIKASDIDEGVREYQDELKEYIAELDSRNQPRFGTRLYMYFFHKGNNTYSDMGIKDVYFRNYAQLRGSINKFIVEKVDRIRHTQIECLVRHYERLHGNHIDWILNEESYARLCANPALRVIIIVTYP